jgi:hypothetical protein
MGGFSVIENALIDYEKGKNILTITKSEKKSPP